MTKLDQALEKLKDATPVQQDEVAEAILFLLDNEGLRLTDEDAAEIQRRLNKDGPVVEHDDALAWLAARRR